MERKHYRIIALDMDGTLLTSDKTIAPDTVRDIRAASERGIHVVYCTGRAVPELKLYFDMVPMMRYAVCSTGALVYDRVEKHCIDRRPVKSELAAALAETAKRYRAMPHILTDDEIIVAADDVTHMKDFHAGIYQPMFERITRKVADMAEEARHLTSIGKVNIYFRSSEDCHACITKHHALVACAADLVVGAQCDIGALAVHIGDDGAGRHEGQRPEGACGLSAYPDGADRRHRRLR